MEKCYKETVLKVNLLMKDYEKKVGLAGIIFELKSQDKQTLM